MKLVFVALTVVAVGAAGVAVFFSSREAAAKKAAAEGFVVTENCTHIEVTDRDAAKRALTNGAIFALRSMHEPAVDFIDRVLATMFKDNEGCVTDGKLPNGTVFYVDDHKIPLGMALLVVHGKTVGDLKEMAKKGSDIAAKLGLEGAAPSPVSNFLINAIFGETP